MLHTSLSSFCVCHLTQGNLHKNTQKNMCFFLAFLLSVEALLAGRWMLIWVFFLSMYVCLVLHKWAVHKTVCVTRKMAGVGHLALYWARSSLRAAQSGWCRDCPGTQHSCDPAYRHTYSCMYSSFVQYQAYSCFNLVLLSCKKSRNLFYIFIIFST